MKHMRINVKFLFILFIGLTDLFAGEGYSNSNKSLFVFPDYTALGGSSLVFSRDGAPMSNPANLSLESSTNVRVAYSGFYENAFSTSLASFVTSFRDKFGVGVSIGYLYIPDIEITDNLEVDEESQDPIYDPSLLTIETSSEIFFNASVSSIFLQNERLHASWGAALHCQRRRLIDWTGYGIGADAGVSLTLDSIGLRFSLVFDDLTTNYIHWSADYHDNSLPHCRLGIGWRQEFPYIYGRLSAMYKSPDLFSQEGVYYNLFSEKAGTMDEPKKQSLKDEPSLLLTAAAYGFEYLVHNTVALRIGLDESKRIFFGGGVSLFQQTIDFDFSYMTSYALPGTYSLSMSYNRL